MTRVREAEDVVETTRPGSPMALRAVLVLLPAVAVFAAVGAMALSGAAAPTVLLDPGALVRWGLPPVTVLRELATALTLGSLLLVAFVLPPRTGAALGPGLAAAGGSAWTMLSVLHVVLTYASVSGRPIGGADFGTELWFFVTQIPMGQIVLAMTVLAAVTSVLALTVTGPRSALAVALFAAVPLALQAQTGHAAGTASHELAISSMWLHLVGAAVWIGMLAAIAILGGRLGDQLAPAVARFSTIAAWAFAAVALSGVISAAIRVGGWSGLATGYGLLVLAKAGLFGILGLLGYAHRRAVIPRLAVAGANGRRRLLWRLVAVELVVMASVSGVAGALGASPPPVPQEPPARPTSAQLVMGHLLPPEPTPMTWLTQWRWDALLAGGCLAAVIVYLRWVRRLRLRGDRWPVGRTVTWTASLALLTWVTSGGPAMYGHILFSAHMIQHMLLAMVVPIGLVLSAPVTLALRALPVRHDGSRGPREWLLGLLHSRVAQFFSHPVIAAGNLAGSMILFYYTPLFELALRHYLGHLAMVVHFSLAGYLFVNALIGIDPGTRRPAFPMRLLLMFATMVFHAFFGVALTTDSTLLVPEWFGLMGHDWGISAIEDQQAGGAIAWGIGELPMLALAISLAVAWTRDDERTALRQDRAAARDGDAELRAYNAMLAEIGARDARPEQPAGAPGAARSTGEDPPSRSD